MKKEDFRRVVRQKLAMVPIDERTRWSENDLFLWWLKAKQEDFSLTWERHSGSDLWQHIPGMCEGLYGSRAI